ncbi:ABC transporter ATP-binding protein/permease [Gordonia sp. HY002]|uniref:ABC transporter ATP-binding protein n=1 Tax=Gordonia zhenghanii TaxID=2911516 RepID=UPI001EF0280A|nr:ABC transporter ATP-binding protein [Gordonia zhenghanii]MCF8568678.1 ABC transporter ATP-binding protein/permease [Gordonia zhenghanii]MCF8606094.1 ABC transporter ATP-binding protein/permease [Gordonia zhenghanii]
MSMETTAWSTMHATMNAQTGHRRIDPALLRRIARFAAPHRRRLAGFAVVSVVVAGLTVATPLLAGRVIDAITRSAPSSTVVVLASIIAGVALAEAGFGLVQRWLSSTIGERLIFDLRTAVYDHVQTMPVAFFSRTRTGALVSRLNNDVIGAQRAFSDAFSGVISNTVTLLLALVAMVSLSWQITLATLVLLPVFLLPARRFGARVAELQRTRAAHNAAMGDRMTERFSAPGATLIKLFGGADRESVEFADRAARVRDVGVRSAMVQEIFYLALMAVSALALALVYGVGGVLALNGQIQTGTVVSLAMLLTRLYAPLTALANTRVEAMSAMVSFERVFEVLDLAPLIADRTDARRVPDGPIGVEFDGVAFAYPAATQISLASLEDVAVLDPRVGGQVLHDVSFTVEPGQTVALVGTSGAGKSTIASLLPRLFDVDEGSVRVGGVDVRDLAAASLHSAVGMVTQDGHLFHDTVRANLTLARRDASDDELWDVLRRARLDGVVAALQEGLDTIVGERGYRFSGGERQRLTIARVLLAKPRVVILDEATAHLDTTSEAQVQLALSEALTGRTAIVIAHRLATVRDADRILVVEDGRVIESGSHLELVDAGGRYAELYSA